MGFLLFFATEAIFEATIPSSAQVKKCIKKILALCNSVAEERNNARVQNQQCAGAKSTTDNTNLVLLRAESSVEKHHAESTSVRTCGRLHIHMHTHVHILSKQLSLHVSRAYVAHQIN